VRLAFGMHRPAAPAVAPATPATPAKGQALLATWAELLDAGRMQDGDEHLAGTAKPARALLNAATAAEVGVAAGGSVAVATDSGTLVLPVVIEHLPDRVVWLPTNARGCSVRVTLGAVSGDVVRLTRADAPPIVGAHPDAAAGAVS
jgi:NADH-quinone oxidoreductase subunit G